eukprot:g12759.t1
MDPNDDRETSQQTAADAAAEMASLSCNDSDGSSAARPATTGSAGSTTHFQAELLAHVQTGHMGLEAALRLLCERLLDLESCWERTQEEHKAKYWEMQQECLDRQQYLSGLNHNVRQDLRNLEKKVNQLQAAPAQEQAVEEVAPSNDAAVDVVIATVTSDSSVDAGGEATIREELRALKTKVDIIAANVLGEAEGESMEITKLGPSPPEGKESFHNNDDGSDTPTPYATTVEGAVDIGVEENNAESLSPTDDKDEATAEKDNQQHPEGRGSENLRLLPQRVRARSNWTKVRVNRAVLVKKIRRQVMAERKVSHSETIANRVERLEQALGVNVYTKGSGRLGVLAREVRLSLNMIVEHQARTASDNLSAPLCLFPAREGDLSLISAAATTLASPPESNGRTDINGGARTSSLKRRLSRLSISSESSSRGSTVGDSAAFVAGGGGSGADGSSTVLSGRFGGDVGRLWMSEDGGYLCVDLLLERTLEELAEGLAFAGSRVEQGRSRGASNSSSTPVGVASVSNSASDAGGIVGSTKKLLLASSTNEGPDEARASKLKREIERMQDRCARLGALVARLGAAQQHEQQRGDMENYGETGLEQPFAGHGAAEQQKQNIFFAAEEPFEERGAAIPPAEAAAIASEVLRLSCALAGDLQYLLSRPAYCRVLESFSFIPGRKCLCGRDFDAHHGNTAATAYTASATTTAGTAGGGGRLSAGEFVGGGDDGTGGCGPDHTHGFRVRPTLYQCFVFSLGHLSCFLATARSRSSHRALSSLTGELKRDVLTAELSAREAVAAAASAQKVARLASAEALEATARAASAAASARNEGSCLLEELHGQLAKAMRAERDRMELEKDERVKAERKKSLLLDTQLGHLKALLDSKAGQEDLTSIAKAMGDVEETLTVVRQSIPGQTAFLELQEALARKADKAYTKRKMTLLVSRVSALLKEESDEPSMAKKCLSCDRAFNKLSFNELELARQLPNVLESVEDTVMPAPQPQQERRVVGGGDPGNAENKGERVGWLKETPAEGGRPGSPGAPARQEAARPGSAPSARPRALEARSFGNNRPSSASPHRLGGGATSGSRPGSSGARARSARGVGGNSSFLPPAGAMAPAGSQSTHHSHLFSPAALSATYGPLSEAARKVRGT